MSICTRTYAVYYNNDYTFVNDFVFFFSFIVIGSVLISYVMFHSSRPSPIREDSLVREREEGRKGEGGGRRGKEREGGKVKRVNDFPCSYRFSSSSFKETTERGWWRSLTTQTSSYTPQQDKR